MRVSIYLFQLCYLIWHQPHNCISKLKHFQPSPATHSSSDLASASFPSAYALNNLALRTRIKPNVLQGDYLLSELISRMPWVSLLNRDDRQRSFLEPHMLPHKELCNCPYISKLPLSSLQFKKFLTPEPTQIWGDIIYITFCNYK